MEQNPTDTVAHVKQVNELQSLKMKVVSVVNSERVKKFFNVGVNVFNSVMPFIEKPTAWSAAKMAFDIGKTMITDMEIWSEDYFLSGTWEAIYNYEFTSMIVAATAKFPYDTITASDDATIKIVHLSSDVKIGYVYNKKTSTVQSSVFCESATATQARELVSRIIWDYHKNSNLIIRAGKSAKPGDYNAIVIEPDDVIENIVSNRSREYSTYLRRCLDAGVNRSVLLYGPPGTGKSTMGRAIVQTLNLKSFRIRVEDVTNIESSTLFQAITIFRPDVIIFDDFDRAHSQTQLLETLEYFQRHVKLVLATANDKNALDEAILRPGRIDELVWVNEMGEDVVRQILGEEHVDAYDIVKMWPVAFINEFIKRRKFMSKEDATKSIIELTNRVDRLTRYAGPSSDVEVMTKLAKSFGAKNAGEMVVLAQSFGGPAPEDDDANFDEEDADDDILADTDE